MSITAEYRCITSDQLAWFTKKPTALYRLLCPDSIQVLEGSTAAPKAKGVWSALAEFQAFTQAMQNPGTNDQAIISKLPSMIRQWRAMVGEEAMQKLLADLAEKHPAVAEYLERKTDSKKVADDDSRLLNIEKAWDGIHFVLTGDKKPGNNPISRAIFGYRAIPDKLKIMGYGPAHVLTVAQVEESARELLRRQPELSSRFDTKKLVEAKVYSIHDDPKELEYLRYHYGRLLRFYEEASAKGQAMVAYMV